MGWGRTLLLGDVGNQLDIQDATRDIEQLKRTIQLDRNTDRSQDMQIQALTKESDELKLYLSSLIRLLVKKGVLSKDEVTSFVDLIDE